jgi:hypothetical protein
MKNSYGLSREEAAQELLRRRRARGSLLDFAKAIDVPGRPVSDDPDEWMFSTIETGLAEHHVLMLEVMEKVINRELPRAMFFLSPGSAKALALNTPIPTPIGWTTMGELRVGDRVFDETGKPCRVTWKSPVWKGRPCYSVKTDCGDEIIADHDHEWLVRLSGGKRKPLMDDADRKDRRGEWRRPDRDDPMSQFKIKETHELSRRRHKRPMIKRAGALVLPEAILPIDPYLLGVWLGDGHSSGIRITASVEDQAWLRGEIERLGYKTSDQSVETQFGVLGVRGKFVKLGLVNDVQHRTFGKKHIPMHAIHKGKYPAKNVSFAGPGGH